MAELTTLARWDALHRDSRHRLDYPSEHVVRWLAGLPPIFLAPHQRKVCALDIGCGYGRHSTLMESRGCAVSSVDKASNTLRTHRGDMTALPFGDEQFDLALAWGVFYYGTMGDADQAVREMHRVLKPGGHGLVSVRSGRDWRADHIDTDGVFRCDGEPEDGMLLDFISEDELQECYGVFGSVSYEISEWTTHDRDRLNSDWLVSVVK